MLRFASKNLVTEWNTGSRSMSPGPSAQMGMRLARLRRAGAHHGSRESAALGIQEQNPTLSVIIRYSPMQKQSGCTRKNIRSVMNSPIQFQFINEQQLNWNYAILSFSSSMTECRMQVEQKGNIGITLVSHWFVPFSRSKSNDDAARRAIDFMLGW